MILSFYNFAGEFRAINALKMPEGSSQAAINLSFRHGGFRPLQKPEFLRNLGEGTVSIVPQGGGFREYDRQVRFEELQGRVIVLDRRGEASPVQLDGAIQIPFGYPASSELGLAEEDALTTGNIARQANSNNLISYLFALTLERTVGDVVEESQLFAVTGAVQLSVGDEVDIEIAEEIREDDNHHASDRVNLYYFAGGNWQRFRSFDLSVALPSSITFRPNRDINANNFVREDEDDFVPQNASAIAIHKQQFAMLAVGHYLYFSRVGVFSQFPEKYRIDIDDPIDDIAILENTVFVFVKGRNPIICRVNHPAAPAIYEADSNFIYSTGANGAGGGHIQHKGGYVALNADGRGQLITTGRIDENTHKQPNAVVALEDEYFAFDSDGGTWLDFRGVYGNGLEIGCFSFSAEYAYARNNSIFFIDNGSAYRYSHPTTDTYERLPATWKSRMVRLPKQNNFGYMLVERDKTQEITSAGIGGMVAQPTGRRRRPVLVRSMVDNHVKIYLETENNDKPILMIDTSKSVGENDLIDLTRDGEMVAERMDTGEVIPMPADYISMYYQLTIEGTDTVTRVVLASYRKELDRE